jgi:phosphoribosyl-ATP pyrophosphohydrolase
MAEERDDTPQDLLDGTLLDQLYEVILERRGADPETSHTAKLFQRGVSKIAQKVGEEAVETVIEAVDGERAPLVEESADLLYHLLVLWAARDVVPAEVWQVLASRRRVAKPFTPGQAAGKPQAEKPLGPGQK